ncbi:HK97 gp10 family phage protein [Oceanobacillus sp. J11TS1]|uniref:HK97 gp10 family phage protein n=1 Tax=Oceanobacillus sp. J11TS1 TaxID=2807191 RepID=UPI001B05E74F|nr:HK97 gp10 family phage protein [Oceanobacillus sp. J11TS1]GIO25097.1 hypothetical protein J11TS1_36780 [Oceanobacillus sp. J11TS1]
MADEIKIVWEGLKEFSNELGGMNKELEKNLKKAMNDYLELAEEGAKALVHRDEGELEERLTAKKPRKEEDRIIGEIGTNLEYAFRRHEEPYRYGVHDKYDRGVLKEGYYVDGRGRRTRDKPNWRGEKPGRKYLERAIILTEDDFEKIMADALERTLGGR